MYETYLFTTEKKERLGIMRSGPKKHNQGNEGSFIVCTLHFILSGWVNQRDWDGTSTKETRNMYRIFTVEYMERVLVRWSKKVYNIMGIRKMDCNYVHWLGPMAGFSGLMF